ncbi:MAG: serine/threonine-protein kinase [Myxococcota bacterium]
MSSTRDEMIGGVLSGRYQLVDHIEEGRFGDFWKAKDQKTNSTVAVKLLKPEMFSDPEAFKRFEREAQLLSEFRHPNLLRVLDHGRTPTDVPWVVTEYIQGRLLSEDISALALKVDEVTYVAAQIAAVLYAAHREGIVHRGLNPDAIFLCEAYGDKHHVKVLDFGLAHLDEIYGGEQLTQVGQRLGNVEYMAPEYIEHFVLNSKTDMYALGILMFEMLCGQPPFVGRKRDVMLKQVNETPYKASELCEQKVPDWLDALIAALLEKEPDKRPENMLIVGKALIARRFPLS